MAEVRAVLARQDGVASWSQLRAAGLQRHHLDRMLRRRELVRVHPRVYADHSGPLTWSQRAWAAVLHAEPAALCLDSAEPQADRSAVIHVAVAAERRWRHRPGYGSTAWPASGISCAGRPVRRA